MDWQVDLLVASSWPLDGSCPRRPLRSKAQSDKRKVHLVFGFLAVSSLKCSIMGLYDRPGGKAY